MVEQHPFPIGLAVHELSRLIRREIEARTRQLGFTEGQWRTLWHLERNQGISQARLADLLETQPISLVRVLDRLEATRLIERRPDPRDRRAVQLYLTTEGVHMLERLKKIAVDIQQSLMGYIGQEDLDHLSKTLQRLRAALDARAEIAAAVKVG